MERSLDLLKELLLVIEKESIPNSSLRSEEVSIPSFTRDQIDYHFELCIDAVFIEAYASRSKNSPTVYFIDRLTWKGHEFLDSIRNDTVMKKVKETVK